MKQAVATLLVALLLAPSFGGVAYAEEPLSIEPAQVEVASTTETVAASTTPELIPETIEPEGEVIGEPTFATFAATTDTSFMPVVDGTILAAGPEESWDRANWIASNFSYNFQLNREDYFKQEGVMTHIVMNLGYFVDDPERIITFEVDGMANCHTEPKTVTEWGILNGARGSNWNQVTIGPFTGDDCTMRADTPTRLVITDGAGRELGTSAIAAPEGSPYNIAIPFIAYSATPIQEDVCADGSCTSNILFLPGFLASRLYTKEGGEERKLWEPNGSDDLRDLKMNPDGTSARVIYTRDVIDVTEVEGLPFHHPKVYGEFLEYLDALQEEEKIADWHAFAYDWRYEVFDIIANGSLKEDGSREYIEQVVDNLALDSKTGKVTIIGHSNGGLLAKALMTRLEAEGKAGVIDRVILVASPQHGTPKGLPALLHGREAASPFGLIMPADVLRASSITFPGAYSLLPSEAYFTAGAGDVATFDTGPLLAPFLTAFGTSVNSYGELSGFVTNSPFTRTTPPAQVGTPAIGSSAHLQKARETHALIDSWTPSPTTEVYEIAGWGNTTMTGIRYFEKEVTLCTGCAPVKTLDYKHIFGNDGDDTVVTQSARLSENGVYFNLFELSDQTGENRKHDNLIGSSYLHSYLNFILGFENLYNEELISSTKPFLTDPQLVLSVHSPVIFSIKDASGQETGIFTPPASAQTDFLYIKEEIDRSSVHYGGDGKYIVLPKSGNYTVSLKGTGSGTFDFIIENMNGAVVKNFDNLPVATTTLATLTVNNGSTTDMKLDIDGDGTVDATVKDKLSRKDAILFCKKEIGLVRTILVRLYLLAVMSSIETAPDQKRYDNFRTELRNYIKQQLGKNIPSDRAAGIALCVTALENSKK